MGREARSRLALRAVAVTTIGALGLGAVAIGAAGDLDPEFGDGGRVTTAFEAEGFDEARAVVVQPDGRIVAGGPSEGASTGGNARFALARYMPDGSLDESFGASGRVRTNFGFLPPPNNTIETSDRVEALALQPDGRIVAVGRTDDGLTDYGIARYEPNGSLDPSFGDGGLVTLDMESGSAFDVALTGEGKILVAGHHAGGSPARKFGLARLESDGSLDEGFGEDGIAVADFPGGEAGAYAMALVPGSDDIVLAGFAQPISGQDFALARFDADGELDPGFGVDGLVTTEFPALGSDVATDVAVLSDGRILAAGTAEAGAGGRRFALVRYSPDGLPDPSFGSGGRVVGEFDFAASERTAIVVGADGAVTMLGTANDFDAGSQAFALARFGPGGGVDAAFGQDGLVLTPFGEAGGGLALAGQSDGKLVAAGATADQTASRFALVRYQAGAPRLAVQGLPRRRAVGPRAKRAAFRLRVTNVGDADTGPLRLCVGAPKRRLAVRGQRCLSRPGAPPGAVRQRRIVLRVKPAARGRVTRVRLVANGPGVEAQATTARLRVRGRR